METAMLVIAMISGIMQGVQTWLTVRDREQTRRAIDKAYVQTLSAPTTLSRAEKLLALVPLRTIELLRRQVQKCYDRFNEMLENGDKYFPQDLTEAAERALPSCVCRSLKMIIDVNGSLPDDELQEAWRRYSCVQFRF